MARYITSFSLPYMDKNILYPFNILAPKKLRNINFAPVTIFYGSNGCGKSTLLNIISRKLDIPMKDKGNDGRFIQPLIDKCSYIPEEIVEAMFIPDERPHFPHPVNKVTIHIDKPIDEYAKKIRWLI